MRMTTVTVISLNETLVYIVLGIDEHEHDQVLAVFNSYSDAKNYCCEMMHDSAYFDLWIEKHPVV